MAHSLAFSAHPHIILLIVVDLIYQKHSVSHKYHDSLSLHNAAFHDRGINVWNAALIPGDLMYSFGARFEDPSVFCNIQAEQQ